MTDPRVSVVVVNYNGREYLSACLASIAAQTFHDYELILVDNASRDGSTDHVRVGYPGLRLIELRRNKGFAGGCNAGIRESRGEFIALINNDAVADPDWLERLVTAAGTEPYLGGVAGKVRFRHEPFVLNSAGLTLSWNGYGADRGFREPDRGQYDEPGEVFGGCGTNVLLRRAMLDDVGLFDESLFMYYEDLDLAWRARWRGWRFLYEPRAAVRHVHCGSSGERSPFFCYHDERNRVLVNAKNNNAVTATYALLSFFVHVGRAWLDVLGGRRPQSFGWTHLKAAGSLARLLPRALAERYRIRHVRRLVPERQIQRLVLSRERRRRCA